MWTFALPASILLPVKRISVYIMLMFAVIASLSAEVVYWSGEERSAVYSSKYTPSSVLSVTNEGTTVKVTVSGKGGETLPGRELGLDRESLEELGLWGKGDRDVKVELLRGSLVELDDEENTEESGWYSLTLRPTKRTLALDNYKALLRNGFKVRVETDGEKITFSIPYVAEYEVEEKKALIESLGLTVESVDAVANPYNI